MRRLRKKWVSAVGFTAVGFGFVGLILRLTNKILAGEGTTIDITMKGLKTTPIAALVVVAVLSVALLGVVIRRRFTPPIMQEKKRIQRQRQK